MGKDSLKMLNVIITRGLPLDGVTTTDVWATDTVRAPAAPQSRIAIPLAKPICGGTTPGWRLPERRWGCERKGYGTASVSTQ